MAKERNLPSKTTLTTSDYIRVVGSDNASYKQLVSSVMATMGLNHDDLGSFANESDLVSALNTKINAMLANSSAYIRIAITANFGVFTSGVTYIGELRKSSANYASISLYGLGINIELIGNKTPSGWDFQRQPSRSEIEALNSKTTGTISKYSSVSGGTLDSTMLTKVGNTVFGSARIYSLSATANGSFFEISSGFRPTDVMRVMGYIYVNNIAIPVPLSVNPNGLISLAYSSSQTLTQIGFSGSWTVK